MDFKRILSERYFDDFSPKPLVKGLSESRKTLEDVEGEYIQTVEEYHEALKSGPVDRTEVREIYQKIQNLERRAKDEFGADLRKLVSTKPVDEMDVGTGGHRRNVDSGVYHVTFSDGTMEDVEAESPYDAKMKFPDRQVVNVKKAVEEGKVPDFNKEPDTQAKDLMENEEEEDLDFDDEEDLDDDLPQEPEDDDIVLGVTGSLGGQTSVSSGGKHIGTETEWDDVVRLVSDWMEKNSFYPSVWKVSDHGNVENVSQSFYDDAKDLGLMESRPARGELAETSEPLVEQDSYYSQELGRISTDGEYPASILVSDGDGNKTKTLDLNPESVAALRQWLDDRYPVTETVDESGVSEDDSPDDRVNAAKGKKLAELLGLSMSDEDLYDTEWGDKTPHGLYLMVKRVLEEARLNEQPEDGEEDVDLEPDAEDEDPDLDNPDLEGGDLEGPEGEGPGVTRVEVPEITDKTYLGNTDNAHFYLNPVTNEDTGEIEDIVVQDAEGREVWSAKEQNVDFHDSTEVLRAAMRDVDVAEVAKEVFTVYLEPAYVAALDVQDQSQFGGDEDEQPEDGEEDVDPAEGPPDDSPPVDDEDLGEKKKTTLADMVSERVKALVKEGV